MLPTLPRNTPVAIVNEPEGLGLAQRAGDHLRVRGRAHSSSLSRITALGSRGSDTIFAVAAYAVDPATVLCTKQPLRAARRSPLWRGGQAS
jgi:hypothetical protein